jgi:hypothetical protein
MALHTQSYLTEAEYLHGEQFSTIGWAEVRSPSIAITNFRNFP